MLEFDIWTIAFSIINILVLFLFLKKFLFGRIQNIMDQRATAVQADLDQAKASKEEAHQLRQQYEDTLSGAKRQVRLLQTPELPQKNREIRLPNRHSRKQAA